MVQQNWTALTSSEIGGRRVIWNSSGSADSFISVGMPLGIAERLRHPTSGTGRTLTPTSSDSLPRRFPRPDGPDEDTDLLGNLFELPQPASAGAVVEGTGEEFSGEVGPGDCPICYREMAVPQLLQCGHSFCEGCAPRLMRGQNLVACPICREPTRMPPSGRLPTNYALKGVSMGLEPDRVVQNSAIRKFRVH
jgi:Zinc finger, C3HC4 type (RING finger)